MTIGVMKVNDIVRRECGGEKSTKRTLGNRVCLENQQENFKRIVNNSHQERERVK